jgi:hypothetical protein
MTEHNIDMPSRSYRRNIIVKTQPFLSQQGIAERITGWFSAAIRLVLAMLAISMVVAGCAQIPHEPLVTQPMSARAEQRHLQRVDCDS